MSKKPATNIFDEILMNGFIMPFIFILGIFAFNWVMNFLKAYVYPYAYKFTIIFGVIVPDAHRWLYVGPFEAEPGNCIKEKRIWKENFSSKKSYIMYIMYDFCQNYKRKGANCKFIYIFYI